MFKVIINEQHTLFPQQKELLKGDVERVNIPSKGLTEVEQENLVWALFSEYSRTDDMIIVFASPIPLLLKLVLVKFGWKNVLVFHNDYRQKKELPSGKIIYTVPQEGWVLV